MKKASSRKPTNDLRPEYDLSRLGRGVRDKYYARATAGSNLVLIEPDLAVFFPDAKSVNRALRLLADAAQATLDTHSRSSASHNRVLRRASVPWADVVSFK